MLEVTHNAVEAKTDALEKRIKELEEEAKVSKVEMEEIRSDVNYITFAFLIFAVLTVLF